MRRVRYMVAMLGWCMSTSAFADVACLVDDAAKQAFVTEEREPYFSLLQPREMAAKTGHVIAGSVLSKQQEQVRVAYRQSVLNCTPGEIKALEGYIAVIEAGLKPHYPGLLALPWRIVKVADSIEGGLPHTRGGVIVLSQSMLDAIEKTAQMEKWDLGIINVLIHEQIHVIQRTMGPTFARLYEEEWGFRRAEKIKGATAWLAQHQIVNPDGVDVQWVWPVPHTSRVIWPRVILEGESNMPVMPGDFRMIGIELAPSADGYVVVTGKGGSPRYRSLRDEEIYMQKFGAVSSIYHPNEIAADYLGNLAVFDCLIDKSRIPQEKLAIVEEVYRPVRAWARSTFGVRTD